MSGAGSYEALIEVNGKIVGSVRLSFNERAGMTKKEGQKVARSVADAVALRITGGRKEKADGTGD